MSISIMIKKLLQKYVQQYCSRRVIDLSRKTEIPLGPLNQIIRLAHFNGAIYLGLQLPYQTLSINESTSPKKFKSVIPLSSARGCVSFII